MHVLYRLVFNLLKIINLSMPLLYSALLYWSGLKCRKLNDTKYA